MDELQQAARVAFATEYAYYLRAHYYHWNVEGTNFFEYHALFEKIYTEVYDVIDDFAEKIRALGAYAPGGFSKLSMLSQLDEEAGIPPQEAMIADLLEGGDKLVKLLKIVYEVAEREKEVGFSNFVAERIAAHQKHNWMLLSSLKRTV